MCYCSIYRSVEGDYQGVGKKGHANVQMARILQYLECPQYLALNNLPESEQSCICVRGIDFASFYNFDM
jgi:hypothetical protein